MDNLPEYVVAIGASAGGLLPLQELVENLPNDIGKVSIVVAQHLSPEYKSMLADIISRKTTLKVTNIVDGEQLQSNHIYITPPNCDAIFKQAQLETVETSETGPHPSIDRLFASLAQAYAEKAVVIVLSGTGQDGSKGLVEVKNRGGLAVSQSLESARYTGMPQAAINTGKVDVILSPEKIGQQLMDIIFADRPIILSAGAKETAQEDYDDTTKLLRLVQERLGTNFNNYKSSTIMRRIEKRLKDMHFPNLKQYLLYIEEKEEELDAFFEYLLIGVTSFFRDEEAYKALRQVLYKKMLEKAGKTSFRVWIPGCATGEESVTISILLHEILRETNRFDIKIQIFATDINAKALRIARRGIYSKDKIEQIPADLVERYFYKEGETYSTNLDIKNSILYTPHDITSSPPFLRLDLLSCRNLFIYFNQQLQNQLFPVFHYALNDGSILFLGKSEAIGNFDNLFDTEDAKYRIFTRKETNHLNAVKLPSKRLTEPFRSGKSDRSGTRPDFTIQNMVKETLYNGYDKPYVVVDETANILEISGDINPFIYIRPGTVNTNLLRLIKEDYQLEVRALIAESNKEKKAVRGRLRRTEMGNAQQLTRVNVVPLQYSKPAFPYFMVIFDVLLVDVPFFPTGEASQSYLEAQRIKELEYELQSNKQQMNTLVEQLETGNEELQALNEEMQSSNEELQASNEELETSNEELQATNEELENAYMDLRTMTGKLGVQKDLWEQLCNASPDMIAVLRGDNFTVEYVNDPFQVMFPNKKLVGNSILTALPDIIDQGYYSILQQVRNSHQSFSANESVFETDFRDSGSREKKFFTYTLAPLLAEKTGKADIIVYAKDVTAIVLARQQVEADAKFFGTLAEAMPQKVWVVDKDGYISYINETFKTYFGIGDFKPQELQIENFIHETDLAQHKEFWLKSFSEKNPFKLLYRLRDEKGQYRWHSCSCRPLFTADGTVSQWICAAVDINEEKSIEEKKDEFMSIASHELKTPLTTLTGYLELVVKVLEEEDCETAKLYTARAAKSLGKISDLVSDLLDVTRIETGQLKFSKVNIDFDKMVKEAIQDFEPFSVKHHLKLQLTPTSAVIYGDPNRLHQVMTNILNNAIKYSEPDTTITIKTALKNEKVFFEVSDNGIGVPTVDTEKIFDRFFRANEKNNFDSGLGIGLYISKQIVKKHQGNIYVKNNPQKGSTFTIELPILV